MRQIRIFFACNFFVINIMTRIVKFLFLGNLQVRKMRFDKALAFTAITASLATTLVAAVVMTPTTVRSASSEIKVSLSDAELDIMFGKDRPKQIGPHKIVYLTKDEAKQIRGAANPVVIGAGIGAIGGGIAGGMQAYDNGSSIPYGIVSGAASGAVGGAMWPGAGGAVSQTVRGVLGGVAGASTNLAMNGQGGICRQCHEDK
ncbi:hypothetical protein ACFQ3K_16995 [Brucella gallinifaecis]|uniref:Uncharacterized protein n=1 Tax=Brucella gallinifaecis TaxID=215590 RepID=A0A502BKI1_9HYPH|nr:hypothetical protein [Brucella gallinifaecis]TPF73876.1 hypothetical protein FHY56_17520 [Brucella gallinifaecis]